VDNATYLGDGVTASFDGYHIVLKTERQHGTETIYLDPGVFAALVRYEQSLREGEEGQS
jgi:hypothetical protein